MEKIKSLLNQVHLITKKNNEILDATGSRFNLFRICGVNHYENTHSAIIAEFLNPNGSHGLKSKFLEMFLETLGDCFTLKNFNYVNAKILTEHSTNEGRIDILIEDDYDQAIIIENKIYASDQPEQLIRYNRFAKEYKKGYQIIYLTLYGDLASSQSGNGVEYISISHKEHIINWLEKCVLVAANFPIVRETINQYINHLKQLTNQDMDTRNREEITELISQKGNLSAAKTIYQNYNATFIHILNKHFNSKMILFASERNLVYNFEKCEESYIRFYLTSEKWEDKIWIGFTFEKNRPRFGIVNNPNTYKLSIDVRKIIHSELSSLGFNDCNESDWWPFYEYIPTLNLENWENDIIASNKIVEDYQNKIDMLLYVIDRVKF